MTRPRTVFADAFYWVALINPKDRSHAQALSLSESLQNAQIITTEEVLTEVLITYHLFFNSKPPVAQRGCPWCS